MLEGCVTAIRTLTRLPCPGRESARFADSLPWFPLVGLLIGCLVAALMTVIEEASLWAAGAGALGAMLSAGLTRNLHLDGLGDAADALGGGRTVERRLAIMKDPHVGAFGVVAIAGDLVLRTVALARLAELGAWPLIPIPFVASRLLQVLLAVNLPYARATGGTAEGFVRDARPGHAAVALVSAFLLIAGVGGIPGMFALLAILALCLPAMRWLRHTFGGVTGDLLGAASEIAEVGSACLLAFSLSALDLWIQ